MTTSTDLNGLPDVVSKYLHQFRQQLDLPIPELNDAPPFSAHDVLRFGVIVINAEEEKRLTVRRNLLGETLGGIAAASLLILTPWLEVEDPEGEHARQSGTYSVRCVGWKVVTGQSGTVALRATVSEVVSSVLRKSV